MPEHAVHPKAIAAAAASCSWNDPTSDALTKSPKVDRLVLMRKLHDAGADDDEADD